MYETCFNIFHNERNIYLRPISNKIVGNPKATPTKATFNKEKKKSLSINRNINTKVYLCEYNIQWQILPAFREQKQVQQI